MEITGVVINYNKAVFSTWPLKKIPIQYKINLALLEFNLNGSVFVKKSKVRPITGPEGPEGE
jgi:hypothetical protein